jgi:alpha,alpha-trehalase
MRKIPLLTLIIIAVQVSAQKVQTPDQIYGVLFRDVQMAKIFPDGKTFVDCVPKKNPKEIVKDYLAAKNNPKLRFSLQLFVEANFELPKTPQLNYITQEKDVVAHIKNLWSVLRRDADKPVVGSSLLPLPYPYIVPGGRFREVYYWDSYFTMQGLKVSGETEMIENMVKNFAYLINTYGHIPNGNRSYYIGRSQPPFFAAMVQLLASIKGDGVYKTFLPALEKEYKFWMDGAANLKAGQVYRRVVKMPNGTVLNRYWDDSNVPRQESWKEDFETAEKSGRNKIEMYKHLRAGAESGIDFSYRWFENDKDITSIIVTDMVPPDLNALLYNLEVCLEKAYSITKNETSRKKFQAASTKRYNAVKKYCYNSSLNYYCDYNWKKNKISSKVTPAGMYPLCFFNLYPETMEALGKSAAKVISDHLLKDGGVTTTDVNTSQQWDTPNGWAPLLWMTVWGLERTGQQALAKDISLRWMKLNNDVFLRTGKLMEKYNVVDTHLEAGGGEYAGQDGFGWTNGVLLALINKYGKP